MLDQLINRKNTLQNRKKNGFTMIELIIVMSILVIIIGTFALVISYNAVSTQDKAVATAAAQAIQISYANYCTVNGEAYHMPAPDELDDHPSIAAEAAASLPDNIAGPGWEVEDILQAPEQYKAKFYYTESGTVVSSTAQPTPESVAISPPGSRGNGSN